LSDLIKVQQQQRNITSFNGYQSMDVQLTLQDGRIVKAKYIIKGSHYYLLAAASKNSKVDFSNFFSSFQFTSFKYPVAQNFVDTFLHYSVSTPIIPELEQDLRALIEKIGNDGGNRFGFSDVDTYWPKARNVLFKSDSTGEMIAVTMQQYPKYFLVKDSSTFWKDEINDYLAKTDFVLAKKEYFKTDDGLTGYNLVLRDTNSSRQINRLVLLKSDRLYRIVSMGDTLNNRSNFVNNFYKTFHPESNLPEKNIFTGSIDNFLKDFFSADSATHAKAQVSISNIYYTKNDIGKLVSIISKLKYNDKDYLDSKSRFISELGYITDTTATADIVNTLKEIYYKTTDTSAFQNVVVRALAKKKTIQSYALLKELLLQDPPVFATGYEYSSFFNDIKDSLLLAKKLFPEFLQLSTIADYKDEINSLLVTLVDSNLVTAKDYENYFTKIYFDAKLELKKQQGRDEKITGPDNKDNSRQKAYLGYNYPDSKTGLDDYAVILMPFYDKPQVQNFFEKLLYSRDQSLQLSTAIIMLRNKKLVPDSLLFMLAVKDVNRVKLFKALETVGLLNKFPKPYKTQIDIARSILSANKLDSIVYLSNKSINFRNKKGFVYFFKYRIKKEDGWRIGISGIQPENIKEVSSNSSLVKLTDKKIKDDEPLNDQLENQLKKLLFSLTKSGKNFYRGENYNRFRKDDY
ncbi:MAG: hypothetical protein ACR2KX_18885, partial [Chitinophagaceae bacterium]